MQPLPGWLQDRKSFWRELRNKKRSLTGLDPINYEELYNMEVKKDTTVSTSSDVQASRISKRQKKITTGKKRSIDDEESTLLTGQQDTPSDVQASRPQKRQKNDYTILESRFNIRKKEGVTGSKSVGQCEKKSKEKKSWRKVSVVKPTPTARLGLNFVPFVHGSESKLMVSLIEEESLFIGTGLRLGMTIQTINGIDYKSGKDGFELFKKSVGRLTIEVSTSALKAKAKFQVGQIVMKDVGGTLTGPFAITKVSLCSGVTREITVNGQPTEARGVRAIMYMSPGRMMPVYPVDSWC